MALWLSSGAFKTRRLPELLVQAELHNIVGIELSSGLEYDPDAQPQVREAHARGGQRFLVHNYFPAPKIPFVLNIASLDPEVLAMTQAFGERALELSRELNAPFYSVHAGFAAHLQPEHLGQPDRLASKLTPDNIDRETAYAVMVETTRHLADHATLLGLDLLIENNVISPIFLERFPINPLLLTGSEEILRFFRDVERSNVGLLLDVAHTRVSATAQGFSARRFVEQVMQHVRCLHLSDNDGREDSNQPIGDDAWFLPLLAEFQGCEVVIEAYRLTPDRLYEQLDLIQRYMG